MDAHVLPLGPIPRDVNEDIADGPFVMLIAAARLCLVPITALLPVTRY